jgi:hypothetical protein
MRQLPMVIMSTLVRAKSILILLVEQKARSSARDSLMIGMRPSKKIRLFGCHSSKDGHQLEKAECLSSTNSL